MIKTGFASQIITPERGIGLAGYFNKRPNRGAYDDVCVKVLLVQQDDLTTGFVVYDLCGYNPELFQRLKDELKQAGVNYADNLIVSCTHTHTGPEVRGTNLGTAGTADYIEAMLRKTVAAVKSAEANLKESTFEIAAEAYNPYAYVRRFWMKSGKVVTNPGKLNPDIVKPDGDFDRTISAIAVKQEGRIYAILVNLANHGDTIGGDLVSADWFGRMEREIQYQLGDDVPVLTLTDASGDINHFDVTTMRDQTSYNEALRIGRGYGKIVTDLLKKLQPVNGDKVVVKKTPFNIPLRTVTAEQLENAKKVIESIPAADMNARGDMTSEDLAKGDALVLRMFAERVLTCEGNEGKFKPTELTAICVGDDLAFISLPGEPFNGIARGIRAESPYKHTIIAELAQGISGYIPMPESFERGGYETEPNGGSADVNTAPMLIEAALKNLSK